MIPVTFFFYGQYLCLPIFAVSAENDTSIESALGSIKTAPSENRRMMESMRSTTMLQNPQISDLTMNDLHSSTRILELESEIGIQLVSLNPLYFK